MVKTRKDFSAAPDEIRCIVLAHQGPPGIGPGRAHLLQVCSIAEIPGTESALLYYATEELCNRAAARLAGKPEIAQDLCITCAPFPFRPTWPRENIYRGPHPAYIVPCRVEPWF